MQYDVVLLTESRYDSPPNPDWYQLQVLNEDALVAAALQQRGLNVFRTDWANPNFDWHATKLAVFRTTWNYYNHLSAFMAWLERAAAQTRFVNDVETIRWNLDKHYLLDLEKRGIPVAETVFLEPGTKVALADYFKEFGVDELILKPCIAAGSKDTYRFDAKGAKNLQAVFDELIPEKAMMIQPFQRNIPLKGEISLMFIGGQYTHAVRKNARDGDFRVQQEFGGSVIPYTPTKAELELAYRCCEACDRPPLYARVDLFEDNDGDMVLTELELIEPELFFRFYPEGANRLGAAIGAFLSSKA